MGASRRRSFPPESLLGAPLMSKYVTDQGIDRTIFLLFGGLVVIVFILLSSVGLQSIEEDAKTLRERDREQQSDSVEVQFEVYGAD